MRFLFSLLICFVLLFTPAVAEPTNCVTPSVFLEKTGILQTNTPVYVLSGEAYKKYAKAVNIGEIADTMMTANLGSRQGVVFFKKGCKVAAFTVPSAVFWNALDKAGMKLEDFMIYPKGVAL